MRSEHKKHEIYIHTHSLYKGNSCGMLYAEMQRCIHLHIYNLISAMILVNKCAGRGNPDVIFLQLPSNTTNMSSVKNHEKGTTLLT
jgi:hypothetical protein